MPADALNPTRRRLLAAAAALPAAQLAGCACQMEAMPAFTAQSGLSALSSESRFVAKTIAPASRAIDAHAHFFNARDVQVYGYLTQAVAHSMEQYADLIHAIAGVVTAIAWLAPTPAAEMTKLAGEHETYRSLKSGDAQDAFDAAAQARREERIRKLYDALKADPAFQKAYGEQQVRKNFAPGAGLTLEQLRAAVDDGTGFGAQNLKSMGIDETIAGLLRFGFLMLNYRVDNLYSFIRSYGNTGTPVVAAVSAMVEFNHWLGKPRNASCMLDQVKVQSQLVRLSGGFLLPVVGYNPATDLREPPDSSGVPAGLAVVKTAVEKYGCIGVKMYPANGFRPYGNAKGTAECEAPPATESWWDGAKLDRYLFALYEYCDKVGVPVMAHSNQSMGSDNKHDDLAAACGWWLLDEALTQQGSHHVRVELGHFGGADNRPGQNWTAEFTKLMGGARSLRVYGDVGFWDALRGNAAAPGARLKEALRTQFADGTTGLQHVMYGSDWLMMARVPGYEQFATVVAAALHAIDLAPDEIDQVMFRNVLDCYQLRPNGANYNRFASIYGDAVMKQARWANA